MGRLPALLAALLIGSWAGVLAAQSATGSADEPIPQTFRMHVKPDISLRCPDTDVAIAHSEAAEDQSFPVQIWHVRGNTSKGVTLTFRLDGPFRTGTGDQDHLRRDAQCRIQLTRVFPSSPFRWSSRNVTLFTNVTGGKLTDFWQSRSTGVGEALIRVNMTFIDSLNGDGYGTYDGGEYVTTLTGEVTENP